MAYETSLTYLRDNWRETYDLLEGSIRGYHLALGKYNGLKGGPSVESTRLQIDVANAREILVSTIKRANASLNARAIEGQFPIDDKGIEALVQALTSQRSTVEQRPTL